MKFGLIKPKEQEFAVIDCRDSTEAEGQAGLKSGEVDFAAIRPRIHIVLSAFGLFVPTNRQHYFAMGRYLYAGKAVLFGTNIKGETVDLELPLPDELIPRWFRFTEEIEWAIDKNLVLRPHLMLNGRVIWRWPEPRPNWIGGDVR